MSRLSGVVLAVLAVLGVAAGVMLVAEPPFIGPDELFHWHRVVQIAHGDWFSARLGPNSWGGAIDRDAFELSIAYLKKYVGQEALPWRDARALAGALALRTPGGVTVPFPSTGAFSPLAYLPQAAGVALGGWAGLDLMQQSYAGRAANLVFYLGLVGVILRVLPWGRIGVLAVMTLPGMLHVAGTLSADPLNLALPVLLVALVLRVRFAPGGAGWALAAIVGLCGAVALLKPTLVAITPVVLLLPGAAFGGVGRAWGFRLGCVAVGGVLAYAWSAAYPFLPGEYWGTGADPAATLARFAAHPLDAVALLGRTLRQWGWAWWQDADSRFGGHGAPFYIDSGPPLADAAMLVAVLLGAVADPPRRADRGAASWLALLAVGYALLIVAAFAIGYAPPGADTVLGVQGRYFLMSFCLAALAVAGGRVVVLPRLSVAVPVLAGAIALGFLVEAIPRLYAMRG